MPNRKVAPKIKKNFRGYNSFRKDLVTLKWSCPLCLKKFCFSYLIKENLCLEGKFNIIIPRQRGFIWNEDSQIIKKLAVIGRI